MGCRSRGGLKSSPLQAFGRARSLLFRVGVLAGLVVTVVGAYRTRDVLLSANAWVKHSFEVKSALQSCESAWQRGDDARVAADLDMIARRTVDNPQQQRNVANAAMLARLGARGEFEATLGEMIAEEERLLARRTGDMARAERQSLMALLGGAAITLALAAASLFLQRLQRVSASRQRALLDAVVDRVDEGIMAIDAQRQMIVMNAVARSMVGRSFPKNHLPEDWRDHLKAMFEHGREMAPEQGALARGLRGETTSGLVYRIFHVRDEEHPGVWISASGEPIRDENGKIIAAVATLRDITDTKLAEQRLLDLSMTDELTGLLNRRGFMMMAEARIAALRAAKAPVALLYADLNGLKKLNDVQGHEMGDRAIKDAGNVMRSVLREGDIVARLGGDEFVALWPNFHAAARDPLLERFNVATNLCAGRPYPLSFSIGITLMDWEKGATLEELLAEADRMMYERKRARARQSSGLRIVR